jgi:transcriptional regulator with XRE-family HTH domain
LERISTQHKMHIGKRLGDLRRVRNLTSEQLAELCGIDDTHIRHIESGSRSPSLGLLIRLCNALKVSPYYFLQDCIELNEDDVSRATELINIFPELSLQKAYAVEEIIKVLNFRFPDN